MRWNWGGTRTGEARICRRVGAGEGRGRGAKSLGGRGEVCERETRQARLVLRDRSMDPGVGAWSKEGRAREEGGGQRATTKACGRVGAAGCCCGGGTHQQASQAPRPSAARHLGYPLDWLQPQGGSQDLPERAIGRNLASRPEPCLKRHKRLTIGGIHRDSAYG